MSTRADDEYLVPKRQAHYVLVLLFLLMAFDFIDRQVLASLLPAIKLEWNLSDQQLGMLVSAVNVAIAIRDDDGKDVAVGERGEVCIRGPQVMLGYWQRPDETAKVMTDDGFFKS